MATGLIVKALSGYYYVLPDEGGSPLQCRARGIFKLKGITPLVGDRVTYTATSGGEGTVDEVSPRKSELVRPPVANADTLLLAASVQNPDLSLLLMDRILVHAEYAGLDVLIVLTKIDLLPEGEVSAEEDPLRLTTDTYRPAGYPVIACSVEQGTGLAEVKQALAGKQTVIAGPSGVGKSSLLNHIIPGASLQTGSVSDRLGRGRHTTRHVELLPHPGGGHIADTPGFSQLEFSNIEAEELGACFPEMANLAGDCKFRGCLHVNEPDCAVREAAANGRIAASRYAHYELFLQEIQQTKRRY